MTVLGNRIGQVGIGSRISPDGAVCWVKQKCAFLFVPAKVLTRGPEIDLFDVTLTNISDNKLIRERIETEAIGITQAQSVDLSHRAGFTDEWVRLGHPILAIGADGVRTSAGEGGIK